MIWLLFVIIIIAYLIYSYNRLIFLKNACNVLWAQVDVNLKLRQDLIPLLVSAAKSYNFYEKKILDDLAKKRAELGASKSVSKKAEIDYKISGSLKSFLLVAENYPKLSADKAFIKLGLELSRVESNIAFKRQFFNDSVYKYNTFLMAFPSNVAGKIFGFKKMEPFRNDSEYSGVKM